MKVVGPLFSFDASGSLGGAIVASKWKGRNYMRRLVTPSNPRSAAQTAQRAMLQFLSRTWNDIGGTFQADWDALAAQGNFSPFNAFTRYNLNSWTQFLYLIMSLNAAAGTPGTLSAVAATGGVGRIDGSVSFSVAGAGNFGVLIAVNTVNDDNFIKTDVKLLIPNTANATDLSYAVTNLSPGAYYVKALPFDHAGVTGVADHSAVANVT